jgi:hypothetical protein
MLRTAARGTRKIASSVLERRRQEHEFSFHSSEHVREEARRSHAEDVAVEAIDCIENLDEGSLLVLELVMRALWVSSNPRRHRR